MPKLVPTLCAACAVLLTASCGGPPEQKAAEIAAKAVLDKLLTQCEDGRVLYAGSSMDMVDVGGFPHPSNDIIEFKNGKISVQAKPLSEADRANGLSWEGQASFVAAMWRERTQGSKQWSRWTDGVNSGKVESFFGGALLGELGNMGQGGVVIIHMWKVKDDVWAYARGSESGGMASMQRPQLLDTIKAKKADCKSIPAT